MKSKSMALFGQISTLVTLLVSLSVHADTTQHSETQMNVKSPNERQLGFTVGAQVPNGIVLELHYRPDPKFSFSVSVGGLPLPETIHDSQFYFGNGSGLFVSDLRARWHVVGTSFFLGLAAGIQQVQTDQRVFYSPHLGWMWVKKSGVTLGTELGVQLPIVSNKPQYYSYLEQIWPYVNIIKVGYMF